MDAEEDHLAATLAARAGESSRAERTAEQQAFGDARRCAGLLPARAAAVLVGAFRSARPSPAEWADSKDVFAVSDTEILEPWATTGRRTQPTKDGSPPRRMGSRKHRQCPNVVCSTRRPHLPCATSSERAMFGYVMPRDIVVDDEGVVVTSPPSRARSAGTSRCAHPGRSASDDPDRGVPASGRGRCC